MYQIHCLHYNVYITMFQKNWRFQLIKYLSLVNITMSFVLEFTFCVSPVKTHTKHLTTISQQGFKWNNQSNKNELHTEKYKNT